MGVDWALTLISDPNVAWIEVDSTTLMRDGTPLPVDDVVIGYADGRMVCCQCKKNQKDFRPWTVDDLGGGELEKAASLLTCEPFAEVRFYSLGNFGELAKLKEYANQTPDQAAFAGAIGAGLQSALTKLENYWAQSLKHDTHTVHELLTRVAFRPTGDADDLKVAIKERLQYMVTRVDDAFNALWTAIDSLGARLNDGRTSTSVHRITRSELVDLLTRVGCSVTTIRTHKEIAKALATMSAIGRDWRRDIAGKQVDRSAIKELLSGTAAKTKAMLLTDGPGVGKTCVLLSVVDALEKDSTVATLFLQAREFADAKGQAARAALGLADDIPALVSGMSQWCHTVAVIDSLDVLSLSRDHENLGYFLGLIDRLRLIPNVTVIAACRNFDLHYNQRLADRKWDRTIVIGPLDWVETVEPIVREWGIDPASLDATSKDLIRNPRNLTAVSSPKRNTWVNELRNRVDQSWPASHRRQPGGS